MSEWRKIDANPKDGSWCELFSPETGQLAVCKWGQLGDTYNDGWRGWNYNFGDAYSDHPKFYRELPQ